MAQLPSISFKYRITQQGRPISGAKNGQATPQALILGQSQIPYQAVYECEVRDGFLVIQFTAEVERYVSGDKKLWGNLQVNKNAIPLMISKANALELERYIERISSYYMAQRRQAALAQAGKADAFRTVPCPHCGATVDLSELMASPTIYCPYCNSIFGSQGQVISPGESYRPCDECNLFGYVKGYTVFQFYFLLVIYGWHYKRRHLCQTCANRIANRNMITNLPFILGFPVAVGMKFSARTGAGSEYRQLIPANRAAQQGDFRKADGLYDQLGNNLPNHPGLLMNRGIAHLNGGDLQGAVDALNASMKACSNYEPTMAIIQRLKSAMQQPQSPRR